MRLLEMDEKLLESYLENVSELVADEDKIVTYKSLSRRLGIHVNTAKQLLHAYYTQQKSENAFPLSATYLLAGKLADGSFNITIINESELESTYPKFVEITSEHIYSIQKGKNVKDINILCGVDKEAQESASLVITSSKCVLKSKELIKKKPESNKEQNKEAISKAFGSEKEKVSLQESNKKADTQKEVVSPKKASPKKPKEKSQGNVKKTGGNIANMFAKAAQKNAEKPKNVKSEEKESRVLNPSEKVNGAERGKNKTNAVAKVGEKNVLKSEEKEEGDSSSGEEVQVFKSKRSKKKTPETSPKKKKGSKRKRIRLDSDSDASESDSVIKDLPDAAVEEEEESLPASAVLEADDEPIESQSLRKRKKRKIVDKTVMHEDGYLETRKEVILGTDSEEEEEEEEAAGAQPKKEEKKKPKPATTNAAKKQSSLLTFFKKS